jgi:hypothetical protein
MVTIPGPAVVPAGGKDAGKSAAAPTRSVFWSVFVSLPLGSERLPLPLSRLGKEYSVINGNATIMFPLLYGNKCL